MRLSGRMVLVTGASVGIGRSIALQVAQEGGHVGLIARSADRLAELQEAIEKRGGSASAFPGDLATEAGIDTLWGEVSSSWGRVDALVNAAGVWHAKGKLLLGPTLEEAAVADIRQVMAVQLYAPILLSRLVVPGMIRQGSGRIVNISGELKSAVGWLHYYVSKKGLEQFTVGLAEELRPHQIQVNCISPSDTLSETYAEYFPGYDPADVLKPEDVARFALFLLSDEAEHITGSVTVIRSKTAQAGDAAHDKLVSSRREVTEGS